MPLWMPYDRLYSKFQLDRAETPATGTAGVRPVRAVRSNFLHDELSTLKHLSIRRARFNLNLSPWRIIIHICTVYSLQILPQYPADSLSKAVAACV